MTHLATPQRRPHAALVLSAFLGVVLQSCWCFAQTPPDRLAALKASLESRLAQSPNDAKTWRLLGKVCQQAGDLPAAQQALLRSVQLDPESAAAHFGLGQVLLALADPTTAAAHFRQAVKLAPYSEYAHEAQAHLAQLPQPPGTEIELVDYEIKRFDQSVAVDPPEDRILLEEPPVSPLSLELETGALFNTNLSLSPTRRDLAPETTESFQGFLNPMMEYSLLDNGLWRLGPTFSGYFTLNEHEFRDLNLQSYQPGFFIERAVLGETSVLVPRVQYDYTLDRFDEATFGRRHALTVSVADYEDCGDTTLVYWTLDYTDFVDDGELPELSSRDGWTNTLGLSYVVPIERLSSSLQLGAEFQRADVDGSDFRYHGVAVNSDLEVRLSDTVVLRLEGGWGYRDYFDSDLIPSRNEHLWHAGARCRKQLTDHWSVSLVFNYDLFDSDNALFTADRYVGGLVTSITF